MGLQQAVRCWSVALIRIGRNTPSKFALVSEFLSTSKENRSNMERVLAIGFPRGIRQLQHVPLAVNDLELVYPLVFGFAAGFEALRRCSTCEMKCCRLVALSIMLSHHDNVTGVSRGGSEIDSDAGV